MTFRRKNEVREERRVEPDEGRRFEEVVRVWMLRVRPPQALAPISEESLADGLAGRLVNLFV